MKQYLTTPITNSTKENPENNHLLPHNEKLDFLGIELPHFEIKELSPNEFELQSIEKNITNIGNKQKNKLKVI